jgi:hypothetical protein
VGAAEPGDAGAGSAEGEPDPGLCPGRAAEGGRNGEGIPGPERQPGPGAGLVLGKEDWPALARCLTCDLRGRLFQAREPAAAGLVVVAEPADHADVVLPQAVAEDRLGGVDIDLIALQEGPDAGCPGGAEVAQPVLLLGFVGGHGSLGRCAPAAAAGQQLRGRWRCGGPTMASR